MNKQEKQKIKTSHFLRNSIICGILIVMVGIVLQYAIFSVVAIRQKMKAFNQQVEVSLLPLNEKVTDSVVLELFREKTFLETRLQISKTDSISLSVNLNDSTLQLELKGVVLKSTKITDFEVDQFLCQLNPATYGYLFGTQLQVKNDLSTISKIPIVVKKAPRDSTEVKASGTSVDTVRAEAVHWMLKLDKDVILKIEGSDQFSQLDWWIGQKFWFRQDLNNLKNNLNQTIRFKTPEYYPEIRLVISESEAKAIYRALPKHPFISVRL